MMMMIIIIIMVEDEDDYDVRRRTLLFDRWCAAGSSGSLLILSFIPFSVNLNSLPLPRKEEGHKTRREAQISWYLLFEFPQRATRLVNANHRQSFARL
jgi:hypothetical protein